MKIHITSEIWKHMHMDGKKFAAYIMGNGSFMYYNKHSETGSHSKEPKE
jgi:hypothetical protein